MGGKSVALPKHMGAVEPCGVNFSRSEPGFFTFIKGEVVFDTPGAFPKYVHQAALELARRVEREDAEVKAARRQRAGEDLACG